MPKSSLIVKSNRLNTAIQNLSLAEVRLIQLAIIDARETNTGLTTDKPLRIDAARYAEAFNVSRQTAFEVILNAEKNLFERRFSFLNDRDRVVKSRWVQRVEYIDDEAAIEIILTHDVVNEITRIDGYETFFTKYLLKQTVDMTSVYSVRIYELLVQWRSARKLPFFDIGDFRQQLGIGSNEYKAMSDFKKRVLDFGLKEINDKSDILVTYEQVKKGRKIIGFKFKVFSKEKPKAILEVNKERDANTADMFTIDGLNNNQLGRIARNPSFVADYNHMVSSTSPAGQDPKAWEFEMINRLKKDASQFKKRPIRDYLEYKDYKKLIR
ncbi:replication initiation protein RepM [Psychrobacter sp. GP33]|uniref:replication initiation protein RepM n=1 Tax=Psychrobacter sp. GP33 TaxID=2758709 RepID=UPI0015F83850|nr:replication initiation protein RepM [Psychrobacter sp. GP33]